MKVCLQKRLILGVLVILGIGLPSCYRAETAEEETEENRNTDPSSDGSTTISFEDVKRDSQDNMTRQSGQYD